MMNRSLLFLLVLAVAGCTRGMDKAEIPGLYEFGIDNVKQKITIGADGKYTNAFYRDGALVWSDQGAWTRNRKENPASPSPNSGSASLGMLLNQAIGS